MWNALGTRISLSKAPNSFFPEPEPTAAQPASAAHAMGRHCDLAFGTDAPAASHPFSDAASDPGVTTELKYSWLQPFLFSLVCFLPSCSRSSSG